MRFSNTLSPSVVCIELLTPPVFQLERFNRTLSGMEWRDNRKYRQRLDSLNAAHAVVAPYAHQMRIILHEQDDLEKFRNLCTVAGISRPILAKVDAFKKGFYTGQRLHNIRLQLAEFDFVVAFQVEALLRNGLVTTDDLFNFLLNPIKQLCKRDPENAGDLLRLFTDAMRSKNPYPGKQMVETLETVCKRDEKALATRLSSGNFACHHVTVTPTRLLLEGPYVIQSNRVIREFEGYQEHFLRVDFRDEDRLQYRWDRDVRSVPPCRWLELNLVHVHRQMAPLFCKTASAVS